MKCDEPEEPLLTEGQDKAKSDEDMQGQDQECGEEEDRSLPSVARRLGGGPPQGRAPGLGPQVPRPQTVRPPGRRHRAVWVG